MNEVVALMVGSRMVVIAGAASLLVLALADAASPARGAECDRARSIFAERDRTGDVAATRPRRDCASASAGAIVEPRRPSTRRDPPDLHHGSPFAGFSYDPHAFAPGFNPAPGAIGSGFHPPPGGH